MKKIILPILLFCASAASAQTLEQIKEMGRNGTGVSGTRMSMTGAEMNKMFAGRKFAPGIYDKDLKPVDSAEAIKLTKTYEYGISQMNKGDGGPWYRILVKYDLAAEAKRDAELKKEHAPKNPALQEGQILDLKPFGSRIPEKNVAGKAVVIIFWYPGFRGYPNGFAEHNEIISNYIGKGNFEVYAVTRYPYEQATNALLTTPITNAHHLTDAGDLVSIYAPDHLPLLIVTDKDHKITYSVTGNLGITPRILNGLLKAL